MTGKIKVLLPLLLIFLLVGCGKTDDGLTIEGHDWTYANAIDSAGQPLDLSVLTCAAQDGSLTVTDSDGSTQSGTYTLTQHDACLLYTSPSSMILRWIARPVRRLSASRNTPTLRAGKAASIR